MRNLRRVLAMPLLACASVILVGPGHADDLPALAARLEPSVVSIIAFEPGRPSTAETYRVVGGGCFVSKAGHVLTADHVLRRVIQPEGHIRRKPDVRRLAVGWMADAASEEATIVTNPSGTSIRVLRRDRARDIALIQVLADADTVPGLLADGDIPTGTDVIVMGFPFGNTLGFRPLLTRATVAGSRSLPGRTKHADRFRGYILDGSVQHGHSGAPVFDASTGRVVGLVQRRITETIPVAIAASELVAFLEAEALQPLPLEQE